MFVNLTTVVLGSRTKGDFFITDFLKFINEYVLFLSLKFL